MLTLNTEIETLDIEIDGKEYHVPLEPTIKDIKGDALKMLTDKNASSEQFAQWFVEYLKKFIPSVDKLPASALIKITEEWSARSALTGKADLGK